MRAFLDDLEAIDPEWELRWVATSHVHDGPANLSAEGLQRVLDKSPELRGYKDLPGVGYKMRLSAGDGTARSITVWAAGDAEAAPNQIDVSLPTEP